MRAVVVGILAFAAGLSLGLFRRGDEAPPRAPRDGNGWDLLDREDLVTIVPASPAPRGEGVLTGRVRTESLEPLEGVLVVATPERDVQPSLERATAWWPDHGTPARPAIDARREEWIADAEWARAARREARTDEDGRFELRGLAAWPHAVGAYHDDFNIRLQGVDGNTVTPDAELEFLAKRYLPVEVVVRGPRGLPNRWLKVKGSTSASFRWQDGLRRIELPPGRYTLRMTGGRKLEYESAPVDLEVTEEGGERVEIVLAGKPTLTGRITMPEGLALPDGVYVKCLPADGASGTPSARDFFHADDGKRARRGRYTVAGLENREYFIAVQLGSLRVHHVSRVMVDGVTTHDIALPAPAPGTYVVARVLGPDGAPPSSWWFAQVVVRHPNMNMSGGSNSILRSDGARLLLLPHWDEKRYGELDDRARFFVDASAPGLGAVRRECERGGTAEIRFREPARLAVVVEGAAGHGLDGTIGVEIRRGGRPIEPWSPIDAEGAFRREGVQPGPIDVVLALDRSLWLAEREVDLKSGENEVRFAVPRLHPLTIRVPGVDGGTVWFRMGEHGYHKAPVDAAGTARVELPAGEYEIGYEAARKATVRVPDRAAVTLR